MVFTRSVSGVDPGRVPQPYPYPGPSTVLMLLSTSNWSDSRQRFESGLCLGFANSLPLAVGAMVFEVC